MDREADLIFFTPAHSLRPAIMAVAAPHDPGFRPMAADAPGQMLYDGANLFAVGRFAFAQNDRDRLAALHVIDVDRQKTAAIVMSVPMQQLLTAMDFVNGVIDIERDRSGDGRRARAELVHKRRSQPSGLVL
jgi:hypothetical protein